jgi:hypothetical protein
MARKAFIDRKFNEKSRALITVCNAVIEEYQEQGLRLTLRQRYYQLVTKNVIPNVERSYKNLGSVVADARMAGEMDWDAIEDRVRRPRKASQWDSIPDLVDSALDAFRLPRWEGQDNYVELWVEKDALAGVLEPLAWDHHVTLMVNRGYSSASAMYESANRIRYHGKGKDRRIIFYLGDHDPSGEDMVRDVRDRLNLFGAGVEVEKLALTMEQVREYDPPPNPAKMSDSRAAAYVAEHGDESWEVDALPPNVLTQIITDAFDGVLDREKMQEVIEREEEGKEKLREAALTIKV